MPTIPCVIRLLTSEHEEIQEIAVSVIEKLTNYREFHTEVLTI